VRREGKYGFHCTDIHETRVCPAALCGETYTELCTYRSNCIDSAAESHLCLQVNRESDGADSQETHAGVKNCSTEFRRNVQTVQSLLAGNSRRRDGVFTDDVLFSLREERLSRRCLWPRGLRHRFVAIRSLRYPARTWMSVSFLVLYVACEGRSLVQRSPTECVCVCVYVIECHQG
jgi:hypothetical protein